LRAVFDTVVADAEKQGLLGWAPAWAHRHRVIVDSFDSFLDVDAAEVRSGPGLAPESTELEFGMGDGPDVPVTLADGSVVLLRGAIDRLDVSADGTCVGVVDYKTGKSATFKDLLGIPRPRGAVPRREKVQDLVYDAAARVLQPGATDIKVSFVFVPDLGTVTAVVASHVDDRPAALLDQLEALAGAGRRGRFAPLPRGRYDYCPVCTAMGRQATRAAAAAGMADGSGEADSDG
jgi:ATP-dependent helicase/nuclease subunit B